MSLTYNNQHLKVNSNVDANADQRVMTHTRNTIDFHTVNRCPLFVMLHRQCCLMSNTLYILDKIQTPAQRWTSLVFCHKIVLM